MKVIPQHNRPFRTDHLRVGYDVKDDLFLLQAWAPSPIGLVGERPASYNGAVNWCKHILEKKDGGMYGRWTFPATDTNVLLILDAWKDREVEILEEAKLRWDYLHLRFVQLLELARVKAEFKENATLPRTPTDYQDHEVRPLAPYQTLATLTSINVEGAALFMEQGTGKTPIVIRRIMHESKHKDGMYCVIVCCPKNVRSNWAREIERFATIKGRVTILYGSQLNRVKQLVAAMQNNGARYSVVVSSYETIIRSWEALRMIEWDLGVLDESHMIKSPSAKRSKQVLKLRDRCKQRMVLTGTPYGNTIVDLYTQLEFLAQGMSGFSKPRFFSRFYGRYTQPDQHGRCTYLGYQNLPILHERLAGLSCMFKKKEVMPDLPDKTYDIVEIEMTPPQQESYVALQTQLQYEIDEMLEGIEGDVPKVTVNNILTKLLRLSQITGGYLTVDQQFDDDGNERWENEERIRWFDLNPKIDQLVEDIKAKDPLEKTIVWTCWVPLIERVVERLKAEGIKVVRFYGKVGDKERDEAEMSFNRDPEVRVFIGNPAAGGTGLNLPGYVPDWEGTPQDHGCNASHTIFLARNWSSIQSSQAEGRNHGKGRCRVPIRVTDYVVPHSIDDQILTRVMDKLSAAEDVQDITETLRAILNDKPGLED